MQLGRFTNYHPCTYKCSWGGSPSGQESNFRQLAEEEGFLLVSAINLLLPNKQLHQTLECSSWLINLILECCLRYQAKGWVTLMDPPMLLAGGVGMCHRFWVICFWYLVFGDLERVTVFWSPAKTLAKFEFCRKMVLLVPCVTPTGVSWLNWCLPKSFPKSFPNLAKQETLLFQNPLGWHWLLWLLWRL